MTKKEKELLRKAYAIINHLIIADNERAFNRLEKNVKKHPERYSVDFLERYYDGQPAEALSAALRLRSQRLGE